MLKALTIRLAPHEAMVLNDLSERAHVPQAEIVRWAILTFNRCVEAEWRNLTYVDLFRASEDAREKYIG